MLQRMKIYNSLKIWIPMGVLIAGLSLSGCFRTREVEPPGTNSSEWISPTSYPILLDNLERAIEQRNSQNYLRCFNDDSLKFVPATNVYINNEILWDNWNTTDERTYIENLFANLAILSGNYLNFTESNLQSLSQDSVTWTGLYELNINHKDSLLTTKLKGQVEFLIKINQFNEWEIQRWTDTELFADSSWSALKLRFTN